MPGTRRLRRARRLPSLADRAPYTTSRAHGRGRCYETLGVFTPHGTAAHGGVADTGSSSWDGTRGRLGRGSGHGGSAGGRALSAQPWLGPGRGAARRCWQGLAEAQPDVLHQAWDAVGAAYLRRAQVFPAPFISPSKLCSIAAPAFLPGVVNGSGCLRTYPRRRLLQPQASRRSEGWARVSSPSPGG